jgi:DNA-binding winged helix-turn-helix (wHTH) protein
MPDGNRIPDLPRTNILCFGPFRLDVVAGELQHGERRLLLQEQPLKILILLLARPGEVVTREEIRRALWPDNTVVEFDHSINAALKKLRNALGDSTDEPRFVETVARRGYRLIAPLIGVTTTTSELTQLAEHTPSPTTPASFSEAALQEMQYGRWPKRAVLATFVVLACISFLVWYMFRPLPVLRVTKYKKISHDGVRRSIVGVDASRIYLNADGDIGAEVSTSGGDVQSFPIPIANLWLLDVSPDGSKVLLNSPSSFRENSQLWTYSLVGGALKRVETLQRQQRFGRVTEDRSLTSLRIPTLT